MAEKKEIKASMSMKTDELLKIADEMGIKLDSKVTKADIIAAIEAEAKTEAPAEKKAEEKKETKPEEKKAVESEEKKESSGEDAEKAQEKTEELKASTERKRREKAERREAKAARKEANKTEEKKTRPNNILLAILIVGVLLAMFAFVGGYNYFNKPASLEAYFKDSGMAEMYNNVDYDEHSKMKVKAEDNTLKIVLKLNDDASDEVVKEYTTEDREKDLNYMRASLLTSLKSMTRGFGAEVRIAVKKGDETIWYNKMSHSEAKKFLKKLEKEAEEEADNAEDAAEDAAEEHDHEHEEGEEHDHDNAEE